MKKTKGLIPKTVNTKTFLATILTLTIVVAFTLNYALSASTITIVPASFVETADYTIWEDSGTYYTKNDIGEVPYSGTNAATVIQATVDASVDGDVILIKSGQYYVNTRIDIIDKAIVLRGSVPLPSRVRGASFRSNLLDNDYYIKVKAETDDIRGGGIYDISFYNYAAMNIKTQYGILLEATGEYGIQDFTIEGIRTCYLKRGITMDGDCWWNQISDVAFDSYNANFIGEYGIAYIKSNDSRLYWFAPKFNVVNNLKMWASGTWEDAIRINHSRADYNVFRDLSFGVANYTCSCIYDSGISNYYYGIHTQDLVATPASFQGIIVIEKREDPNPPAPPEVTYGGFGNHFRRIAVAHSKAVTFLGGALRNEIEITSFNQETININGTGAGIDNKVIISNAMHRYVGDSFSISVAGNVKVTGYGTENSGTAEFADNSTTTFNHDLAGTPTFVSCSFNSTATGAYSWTATSTQITVTVAVSGNYTVYWIAEYKP